MSSNRKIDKAVSVDFLEKVPLSRPAAELEGLSASQLPNLPKYDGGVQQAVTIGSQISEFAEAVPIELRPYIDNAFLLAQLAANFHIEEYGGGSSEWYDKYEEVLLNVGWVIENKGDAFHKVSGMSLEVHKEIIPIITLALGPAAAAASVVVAALRGLSAMDKDKPWITLFDRESQRATANQFQISYVDVDGNQMPRLTLTSFELSATRSVTQVLFFKFSNTDATLSHNETKMSINQMAFDAAKDVVSNRVSTRTQGYLTDLKI